MPCPSQCSRVNQPDYPRPCVTFLNKDDFYSVRLLASCQTPKLEHHSWSAVHDCLFNIFAANFHIWRPIPHPQARGRAMPWWQEPTDGYSQLQIKYKFFTFQWFTEHCGIEGKENTDSLAKKKHEIWCKPTSDPHPSTRKPMSINEQETTRNS